ncbi:MAG: NAD(P)H-dependent glycerol-3-phosphate dehydrogenase [Bacilli bacterium]|nr:NAD(P)H-dependent glycerol-3-phosphate dehydrogenase [Bacilli bacterium]
MKIAVLGTGAYGLAIAHSLAKNKHSIVMWTENENKYSEWLNTKNLASIIPDYNMPENIEVNNDIEYVVKDAKAIFITCASRYVYSVANQIKNLYNKTIPICIASKGIEEITCRFMSDVVKDVLHSSSICVISGPTFAIDILHNEPVALAIASTNFKARSFITKLLSSDTLKLRKSNDLIGVQICGSVKNIIAIASGILAGLGYSESTQAFLINESLHDIKELIGYLGGKKKTILSYAGVGDLLMTSMSKKSRNYSFGLVCATGDSKQINDFLDTHTVEGYFTLKIVIKLIKSKKINIPIIYLINNIVEGKKDPHELANFLINKK